MLARGLNDPEWRSKPVVFREGCYICEDPEFSLMGLPLCRKCEACELSDCTKGHIPADDEECDCCGYSDCGMGFFREGFTPEGNEVGKHDLKELR
jgi:hypothetical protein